MVSYVHHVPGRLRIKMAGLKHNTRAAAEIERLLGEFPGILRCEASTVTGSVIVGYDPGVTDTDRIIDHLKVHAGIYVDSAVRIATAGEDALGRTLSAVGEAAGKALFGFVVEKAMERSAIALIGALL